ncbi:MAG TPA: hypothetical protein PLE92_03900, partial [Lentisphaeria bacterium]|nr:hypothetical protein [Lentisphaeria bacterium]
RWHRSQLESRLKQVAKHPTLPLIIGIDRAACNDRELRDQLEQSEWFEQRGFFFRDYPTVEKTLKCLRNFQFN